MKLFEFTFIATLVLLPHLSTLELHGGVTNSVPAELDQPNELALAGVMAARAGLDQALQRDPGTFNTAEFKAARQLIVDRTRQLAKRVAEFRGQFPTNDVIQISQQGIFSEVLTGMLQTQYSAHLGSLAEAIPSCRFEMTMRAGWHISGEQAAHLQSADESAFADAVIAALKLAPENYNGVYAFLNRANSTAGKTLAAAILSAPGIDESLNLSASRVQNRIFAAGTPLSLKFTAVDGRQVDLARMRGMVVLVEFWATGCVPCVAGLPELELLYKKYRDRGFEVVGISTDSDKKVLQRVIQEKAIPWPIQMAQNDRNGKFETECGVSGIPNYWLVDSKGIVRETMANLNLEEKIEGLLAERP